MRARVSGGTWTSLPRGQRSSKRTRPPPIAGRNAAAADVLATANLTVASEPQAARPPVMLFQEKAAPTLDMALGIHVHFRAQRVVESCEYSVHGLALSVGK